MQLKDVARNRNGCAFLPADRPLQRKPAVIIAVYQAPGSNALSVAKQLKVQMEELKSRFPQGLEYAVSLDTTLPVTEGMKEIVTYITGSNRFGHHRRISIPSGLARNTDSSDCRARLSHRYLRRLSDVGIFH